LVSVLVNENYTTSKHIFASQVTGKWTGSSCLSSFWNINCLHADNSISHSLCMEQHS